MHQPVIRFGEFELDPDRCQLRRDGRPQKIERIPMELLTLLVQNRGKVVGREEIIERLWGKDVFLETEHSINTAMNKVRRVLRDDPGNPRFVQTVFGKGYRFLAATTIVSEPEAAAFASAALQPAISAGPNEQTQVAAAAAAQKAPVSGMGSFAPATDTAPFPEMGGKKQLTDDREEGERPQAIAPDAIDARRGLRRGWLVVIVLAACALIYPAVQLVRRWRAPSSPAVSLEIRSIAVLPLANLSGDPEQEYLVDGMTDQLITDLARATSLRVISRTSAMQYKGAHKTLPEIARALNVDAVVEGSILPAQGVVRITAQLLDARTDRHLWAQSYERNAQDLLATQDEVAQDIVQEIAAKLQPVRHSNTENNVSAEAYDKYLHGRYFWNRRTLVDLQRSIDYYNQSIALAPNFAPAYAALGDSYAVISYRGGPPPAESYSRARQAARKALQLDDSLADAHALLGEVMVNYDWDWAGGEREFERSEQLNPNYATAHHWHAILLGLLGRQQEAQAEIDHALSVDPLSLVINGTRGELLYWARDFDHAEEAVRPTLELDSHFPDTYATLGRIDEQKKQYQEAVDSFQRAVDYSGGNPKMLMLRAHALALWGKKKEASDAVNQLVSSKHGYLANSDVAAVYCAMGQPDSAMAWLKKASDDREEGMTQLGVEPLFDGCRSDPRFQTLLHSLNLTQ
jgi:TolB-like protein/DNA-binding winged helix-turn-helix (wHTH) protein/Flp pilus assembly protein TadD